jgi:long-chain fatty acid transport protein
MKRFLVGSLWALIRATGFGVLTSQAYAAGFQLWEQDGASVGNYHAGYAAEAANASTAFYNPAGLTRFKNQQIVMAGAGVFTSFKYQGTVSVNQLDDSGPQPVTAQGGSVGFIPALHFATPLNDKIGFGFSVDVPFGLKTDYGKSTILRYISTESSVMVVDISPSIGFKLTDKASLGLGPDVQIMKGEFDQIGTFADETMDSNGINQASDTGYGYHAGALYEFSPETRVGMSYHSQVVHHLTGRSSFTGPLAEALQTNIRSRQASVNITLPPYTALSAYHRLHNNFAIMGSVIYTQWNLIQHLVLQNVAGIKLVNGDPTPSTSIVVDIPQHFRNTWNVSIGADYFATDKIILRTGVGFDQTPARNAYRNVQMPDNNRFVVALGGHYQASQAIGLDLGWMHVFMDQAHVNPPPQVTGAEVGVTNGSVKGGADVIAGQVTWDIV